MPPFLRVTSCSPSARARTVTAHSLKAVGMAREDLQVLTAPGRKSRSRGAGRRILRIGPRIASGFVWWRRPLPLLHDLHHGGKILLSQAFSLGSRVGALRQLAELHPGAQPLGLGEAVPHVLEH